MATYRPISGYPLPISGPCTTVSPWGGQIRAGGGWPGAVIGAQKSFVRAGVGMADIPGAEGLMGPESLREGADHAAVDAHDHAGYV